MAKFGFLSHADMSIYFFRAPIMRELKRLGHEVFAIAPQGEYTDRLKSEFNCVTYELDRASRRTSQTCLAPLRLKRRA